MSESNASLAHNRWVTFIVAVLVTIVNFGFVFSLGAIFVDMLQRFKSTRTLTALLQSLLIFMTAFGVVAGVLISKYGLRNISLLGSLLASAGMGMSFFATSIWHLYITVSTITGYASNIRTFAVFLCCCSGGCLFCIGITLLYICSTVSIGYAFEGRAKLNALAVQASSIGIGAAVYPYLLRYLTSTYGINGTLLILSGVYLNNFAATFLFPGLNGIETSTNNEMGEFLSDSNNIRDGQLRTPIFKRWYMPIKSELSSIISVPYAMTLVATALGQSLSDGFAVVYFDIFVWKTFTEQATGSIIVYQIASITVRLMSGVLMQFKCMDSLTIPVVCSLCGCFGVITIYFSMHYMIAYVGSGLIGMTTGGFIAGSGIVVAEIVPKKKFGVAYGLIISSIALLSFGTGPLFGAIRDSAQSYIPVFVLLGVLYFTSACLYLIALIVRRSRNRKLVNED